MTRDADTRDVDFSIVIATHDPDPARFRRVLAALRDAAHGESAEVIVVRNCGPAIPEHVLAAGPPLTLVDEDRQGIVWARARGISVSAGRYVVFVDDDTLLSADYLREARHYLSRQSDTGVFGGRIVGEFAVQPSSEIKPALPFLALRDLGPAPIQVSAGEALYFDVPGAGMVLHRDVALAFRDMVEAGQLVGIGRAGASLASGDDTVCCRLARRMGLSLAYAPQLNLTHVIPARRLELEYLKRLVRSVGASAARIDVIFDGPSGLRILPHTQLAMRCVAHLLRNGWPGGWITFAWHMGYREEAVQLTAAMRPPMGLPRR